MRKEMQKRLNRLFPHDQNHPQKEEDPKLNQIIRTFRENHLQLIHKIEECDKKREIEHQMSKKKLNDKYLPEKNDFQPSKIIEAHVVPRPYSQIKSERNGEKGVKENFRKENINWDSVKRTPANRSEEC